MDGQYDVNYSIRIAIGVCGIILNMPLIMIIFSRQRRNLPFDITLSSLAIADFIASLITTVSFILFLMFRHRLIGIPYLQEIVLLNAVGVHLTITSSILHLSFIAMQRVAIVLSPFSAKRYLTKRSCILAISLIWLLSAIYIILVALKRFRVHILLSWFIVVGSVVLLISYSIVVYNLVKPSAIPQTTAAMERRRSASFYCLVITLAFLVCSLPFAASSLFERQIGLDFQIVSDWLLCINATVDPIIYLVFEFCNRVFPNCCNICIRKRRVGSLKDGAREMVEIKA